MPSRINIETGEESELTDRTAGEHALVRPAETAAMRQRRPPKSKRRSVPFQGVFVFCGRKRGNSVARFAGGKRPHKARSCTRSPLRRFDGLRRHQSAALLLPSLQVDGRRGVLGVAGRWTLLDPLHDSPQTARRFGLGKHCVGSQRAASALTRCQTAAPPDRMALGSTTTLGHAIAAPTCCRTPGRDWSARRASCAAAACHFKES